jgi:hypothetical protein
MYTNTSSAIGDIGHFQNPLSRFDQDQISAEKNTSHTPLNSPNTALNLSHVTLAMLHRFALSSTNSAVAKHKTGFWNWPKE